MTEDNLLIFMHIPKTGGTTLSSIIQNQYDNNIVLTEHTDMNVEEIEKSNSLMGHFYFGIHDNFSKPCTYITMMRDPVELITSLYFYIKETALHPDHSEVSKMSFDEFIHFKEYNYHNLQTRYFCEGQTPSLEQAKETLCTHFTVVGIAEMFNDSLSLMKHCLKWKDIEYQKVNVNKNRPSKEDLPADTLSDIIKYNSLDIELYEYAKERLINELDRMK